MGKDLYRESNVSHKISHICFGMQTPQEIQSAAHVEVVAKNLYNEGPERVPVTNGILDNKMGTSQKNQKCTTCGLGLSDCVGHFGYVDLELPVYHVGYFRSIITILQTICKSCAAVMLSDKDKDMFREKLKNAKLPYLTK